MRQESGHKFEASLSYVVGLPPIALSPQISQRTIFEKYIFEKSESSVFLRKLKLVMLFLYIAPFYDSDPDKQPSAATRLTLSSASVPSGNRSFRALSAF